MVSRILGKALILHQKLLTLELRQKMDLFAPLDLYCERTDAGFFSEPLNLISNLAFIIAGVFLLRRLALKQSSQLATSARILAWQVIIVGVGSALFHSFAMVWSKVCDVVPIGLFILSYLWFFSRNIAMLSRNSAAMGIVIFAIMSIAVASLADPVKANGGQFYFGTWITLLALAFYLAGSRNRLASPKMLFASVLFSISVTMRSIDLTLCDYWPYGTHIFWHLLNACVLYLVVDAYIANDHPSKDAQTREG